MSQKLWTRSPSLPGRLRVSAPPSRGTWRAKGRRWSSITHPARKRPNESSPKSSAKGERPSRCRRILPSKPISTPFLRGEEGVREARHSRQQRRRLRVRCLGRRHRRTFPQDVRPQRARADFSLAGSGQAVRPRRRLHHQYQFRCRHRGPAHRLRCIARPRPPWTR